MKQKVYNYLVTALSLTRKGNFNFSQIADELEIPKEDLDKALNELENERKINQIVLPDHENFTIELVK